MPTYEYRCQSCSESFSMKMTMAQHDRQPVVCPSCKGSSIAPHYATFFAKTSKKS
jgi:putative FmdB family regulatory protein